MESVQTALSETVEEKEIIDAVKAQPVLPGMSEIDAVFLMHIDVPEAILKKLRKHRDVKTQPSGS